VELQSFSFGLPIDRLQIGSLGASSFGTKQWWMDFTDYQFEGIQNFDSFIGIIFLVHSFFYSVFLFCSFFGFFFSLFSRLCLRGYVGIYW